jgi:GT2 family glycosyltransferase
LQQQTQQPDEIIIIIDHNTYLFEIAKKHFQDVIVAENEAENGLSGARNTGIARANGEYIVFLDDDAEAEPDWLELLVRSCVKPHILGVGGTVVPSWQEKPPRWFPSEFYWVVGCTYQSRPKGPIVVRNPYGGCTCIKRDVFQTIGGFQEGIGRIGSNFMGGEETELSIRAMRHWEEKIFLYEPRALIRHHIPAKRARLSYFLSRCYAEGLSKAIISKYVGTKDGLSSERLYTIYTLPRGVVNNIGAMVFQRDPYGLLRAGAIVLGFTMTTIGYLRGRTSVLTKTHSTIQSPPQDTVFISGDDTKQAQIS